MNIIVAGAGAGKTTNMASKVLERNNSIKDNKIIYVITYTNSAKNQIKNKIIELNGILPKNIMIETIHSFLIREVIFPFNHLLFDNKFTGVSEIKLSDNPKLKAIKIKELENRNIIHVEKETEVAKWILYKKSGDKKIHKEKRKKIISIMERYIDSIFIDEAQDIDKNLLEVIKVLDSSSININLIGDPKQDLRGRNVFRELINDINNLDIIYKKENYRCPSKHIELSNEYVEENQKQIPCEDSKIGEINYIFESEINIIEFLKENQFDLIYINKKNDRFITNYNKNLGKEKLFYEIKSILERLEYISDKDLKSYETQKYIINNKLDLNESKIIKYIENEFNCKLTKKEERKLCEVIKENKIENNEERIKVNSIDKVKGLEGERCLFILTKDLYPYFAKEKTDENKMKNYLYVGLTRSKEKLTILITKEIENKFKKLKSV